MRWHDRHDIAILRNKNTPTMSITNKVDSLRKPIFKPTVILDYDIKDVECSDQMSEYYTFTRKTEIMTDAFFMINLSMINTYIVYKKNTVRQRNLLSHFKFKKKLAH